ncbi:hypothetical protein [Tenacibaculum maritimum]|uniref:hypothetical protein n=2 Tax=Tenacibaculum maritimum TaxID=107401 RepID=UPI0038776D26
MINVNKIVQNNTITLARAFLAMSILLTLLFTPLNDLFPLHHISGLKENIRGLMHLNYFLWLDNLLIPYLFSIIVLILAVFGFYPRLISWFHSWVVYSVFYTLLITEGGDQINTILTFLLIPISILDTRINAWKIDTSINLKKNFFFFNAKYSIIFIGIQMAVLYLNAGIAKIFAPEWSNGTAIYYWFFDDMFGAPLWLQNSIGFLFKNDLSVSLVNWSVIFLEIFLFVGLFLKQRYRYVLFILGFFFHFLIVIVHGLPTFWLAMTGGLILYLFKLDESISENIKNLKLTVKSIFKNEKYI